MSVRGLPPSQVLVNLSRVNPICGFDLALACGHGRSVERAHDSVPMAKATTGLPVLDPPAQSLHHDRVDRGLQFATDQGPPLARGGGELLALRLTGVEPCQPVRRRALCPQLPFAPSYCQVISAGPMTAGAIVLLPLYVARQPMTHATLTRSIPANGS